MSALTAKSQFAFELPNLTYIDASLEEANFARAGLAEQAAWPARAGLPHSAPGVRSRPRINELEMMSDRELADIGLSRADVHRVFDQAYNQDLRDRALA